MTHPTHRTRYSDSSRYDEKCIYCGATDAIGETALDRPCPAAPAPDGEEHWVNVSVLGSEYEVEMLANRVPTQYRHRRHKLAGREPDEWTPGPAPSGGMIWLT